MTQPVAVPFPKPGERRPSATRSASARLQRLREEAQKGNRNALRHGVFANVANSVDVATETAIIFATHEDLDRVADHRLVEALAIAAVHHARAILAIDAEGYKPVLTGAARDFGNRAERLERAVHERNRERRRERTAAESVDLAKYRPQAVPS